MGDGRSPTWRLTDSAFWRSRSHETPIQTCGHDRLGTNSGVSMIVGLRTAIAPTSADTSTLIRRLDAGDNDGTVWPVTASETATPGIGG